MTATENRPGLKRLKRVKYLMAAGYVLIVAAALVIVSMLALQKTDEVLEDKVNSLVASLNVQMKLNMDSFLSRMETIGTLAFAAQETYTYDATDPNNDEYEALQTEKAGSPEQANMLTRAGHKLAELIGDNLSTVSRKTTIELNLALLKITHEVKQGKE